ncbi:type I restriction endonuclease subunit R [Desulfosporosinus lacus]|uniref:Type I restriction enzyme endonuclease subunit n=1 Tax=Desulfosporosinus lacus DSM 15449 TaxID=1121420 RepID=A0A1M5QPC3_9FIRM|nr:type I restriction endonuclease subunit R [Desulfosporosinus lacus]SHH15967.1 type I restriction enzyme, R subunit [Desulfosporosinus lacus DSM 15449]
MSRAKDYDEINISQIPALEVLSKLGYIVLPPEKAETMRSTLYNVILKDILYDQLKSINNFEYIGKHYKFSEKSIQQAMLDLDEALTDGLIKTNEKIYDSLHLGRSYPEKLSEMDGTRSFNINYIDWEDPENNVFHVVEEFSVEREDGQGTIRPDLVLFINGIPFGVIECKKASISIAQGISQMLRNQSKEYAPQLFKFVQIVMATNKNETQYATAGTPKKFWSFWKEESEEYKWFEGELKKVVVGRIPTIQDKNIVALFHPRRIVEMMRFFTLFDKNVKKIARYQQYFAIKEIIKTIKETDKNGNRQSGVIWHTQGSGKSLTMVMLARYILSEMAEVHPQVLVITDRIELDSQIHKTFNHSRLKAERASSGRNLVDLINSNGADIITSLVHKFDTASKHQEPVKSKNIFVLIDESHRTQYGELHIKMKRVFPNACYIGFTGTPLMKKDKTTLNKFGSRMIHKYTIKDGVEDGAIVPLLYEGRLVEQTVNRSAIDKRIEMITRNLNEKQAEELKKKWSKFEAIASSEQRIRLIADDIYVHFMKFYKTENAQYTAMLATSSKFDAIRYQEAFEEFGDINTAVVISPPDQREGYEEVDEEPKDRVLKYWNKMMAGYSDPQKYEEHVKSEFVDGTEIDILIVVDKLLTGFDAPRASVLYVDKPMKEHSLLQAIARVNRLYEGKDFGLIVDYRGLIEELDSAMKTYSGAGLENFDGEDIAGALVDVISTVGLLRQAYSNMVAIFKNVKNRDDKEEYELILADEGIRNDFYNELSQFGKYLGVALESEHVYNAIGDKDLAHYKKELKFYQELRAAVKIRYSDTIDHKEYEAKMRNIMDTYIAAEDVIQITAPVDILNEEEFEEEIMRLGSPRAKADAIRTRMTKSINSKWDENPIFYKKFSERIEEIIRDYREKRISEADYLARMHKVKDDYRKGYSGASYPEKIKHNFHAQAFYGVTKEIISENIDVTDKTDILAELAVDMDLIIGKHCKVDWHDNPDVHKRISQEIDGLLYLLKKKHFPELTYKQIDRIIEAVKTVALRRY